MEVMKEQQYCQGISASQQPVLLCHANDDQPVKDNEQRTHPSGQPNITEADQEAVSARLMAASTSTFSDIEEVCSSRETSPLELLHELLLKKNEETREHLE